MVRLALACVGLWCGLPLVAAAQAWDDPAALALVARATESRRLGPGDSTLAGYRSAARGALWFLTQVGEGLDGAPRLVRADEMQVQTYWRPPSRSKQVITAWRHGVEIPYGLDYHRDHLVPVTDDYGDRIRIGNCDEVCDVPHPLAPGATATYAYAITDSVVLDAPDGRVPLVVVQVRPRDPGRPRVVGELALDAASGRLARARLTFTRAAYRDRDLEDVTLVLEHARQGGRWWLPWRQSLELRRRNAIVAFPVRWVIRTTWTVERYELDSIPSDAQLAGPPIAGLAAPDDDPAPWDRPLRETLADAPALVTRDDIARTRADVARLVARDALTGLGRSHLALAGVSDLLRVTRVQGVVAGAGAQFGAGPVVLTPRIAIGFADGRVQGGATAAWQAGAARLELEAGRDVRDVADRLPVISPLLNSVRAQESGNDLGDWLQRTGASLRVLVPLGGRWALQARGGVDRIDSLAVAATPVSGSYRPNPSFGAGTWATARAGLALARPPEAGGGALSGVLELRAGAGTTGWAQGWLDALWQGAMGPGAMAVRGVGVLSSEGAPAWTTIALGGRGTLPGEPYRSFGGRRGALLRAEWLLDVPVPAARLGGVVTTGSRVRIGPLIGAGVAGGAADTPWQPSSGIRPVLGAAVEWPARILRLEAGWSPRAGAFGVTLDAHPDWWRIL